MSTHFPEDFYGFPEIPFHIHLGMGFGRARPDGPAEVTLPAGEEFVHPDGHQSLAAVFTAGEVAAGIAACDALLLHSAQAETELMPLVLTQETTFHPGAPARGRIRSEAGFVGDSAEAVDRLRSARKLKVRTEARLYGEDDELAGRLDVLFYVRLMRRDRMEAMAGALTPRMRGETPAETA